jgi:alkylation response protein AidB-like acyl-CoA dehydrogenase
MPPLDRTQILERSRKLVPVLRERAAQGEALRRVPDETIADLIESRLLRMCQPARFGGGEQGWDVLCEMSIEMARGDGSQAWVANIYAEHPFFVGLFEDEAQHEVWDANPDMLICASIMPQGNRIEPMDGGYRLSGRWSFASGVHHAGWIILGEIVPGADGGHTLFLVPAAFYRIDDDWHTLGMAGTGSASVVVDNLFVPKHRALANRDIVAGQAPGTRLSRAPLYRMPLIGFAQLALAAVPVGVAAGMVEDFADHLRGRLGATPPAGIDLSYERLSEAGAETHAAKLLLLDVVRTAMAKLEGGGALGEADAARSQRDGAYAVTMARRAATRLFEMTGGRGLYLSGPMQRAFRDVLGAAAHGSLSWERSALRHAQFTVAPRRID